MSLPSTAVEKTRGILLNLPSFTLTLWSFSEDQEGCVIVSRS